MTDNIINNRYQIIEVLSKKPGRKTILAEDLAKEEKVVLKLLTFNSDLNWEQYKLFDREAKILQTIDNPSIPHYLDFFELDFSQKKGFVLVQNYIDAISLEAQIKNGRKFCQTEVEEIAKSILEILIYLHEQKPPIIHRDIKPSNILLASRSGHSSGKIYLIDFGSVQNIAANQGGTITIVGTYGYMAPEQFGDRATPASDLYSLGATLIYLITGRHPSELPNKELQIQFEAVATVSPQFSRWLRKMTDPSRETRFASARDALQALQQPELINHITPPLVKKPVDSSIFLIKKSNRIKIVFPAVEYSKDTYIALIYYLISAFVCSLIALSCTVPTILLFINIIVHFADFNFLIIITLLILLTLAKISLSLWRFVLKSIRSFLYVLFGKKIMQIALDNLTIHCFYNLFGFHYNQSCHKLGNKIEKIEVIEGCSPENNLNLPQIIICTAENKYQINGNEFSNNEIEVEKNYNITEPEIDWLARELSDWFGVAIEYK